MINGRFKPGDMKTVDELFDYLLSRERVTVSEICDHIVYYQLDLLKSILFSDTNKPSQYDLSIINSINKHDSKKPLFSIPYPQWKELVNCILQFYKDRKDL